MQRFIKAAGHCLCLMWLAISPALGEVTIEPDMLHVRIPGEREWASFPEQPDVHTLERTFEAQINTSEYCLRLRRQDVKQNWNIELNGQPLGRLRIDENDMVEVFSLPPGSLVDGANQLTISQDTGRNTTPDDIRIGEIAIWESSVDEVLNQARLQIEAVDEQGGHLPAKITITHVGGALQTLGGSSNAHLAVRPGIVYTSTGRAELGVPAGEYEVTVGRGFEYSLAKQTISVAAGDRESLKLAIRREVDTTGYVACDTHVHTLTHSGHGDASVQERMITLAGEGIELPIATDHNVHIDHRPFAREMRVEKYFTPVVGNEVTTSVGHFNIWPVDEGAPPPNFNLTNWPELFDEIFSSPETRIVILNHARDLHLGTIPFGPKLHNAVAGVNVQGWPMRFNGMEVINSAATQTDSLQLCNDWMALLNAGHLVTPVGSSDSHDVGRHFVGQARTYIRCDDRDPSDIKVDRAVEAFLRGEVLVSYGLLCEMNINHKYQVGSTVAPASANLEVAVHVAGPAWTKCSRVMLFANGKEIRSHDVSGNDTQSRPPGSHAVVNWQLEVPKHDMHLVAVAIGPGIDDLHWKTAKPYQPLSSEWTAHTLGVSGAIWVDGDRDGRRWSAADYARRIVANAHGDVATCLAALAGYDEAVAIQTAHQLQLDGFEILSDTLRTALNGTPEHVRAGFERYQLQWRANQIAQVQP